MGKNFASVSSQFRADFWDSGLVSGTKSVGDYKEGEPRTKHEQKIALREKGITGFHDMAKSTNIKAETAKGYVGVMTEMGKWLRERGECLDEKHHFDVRLVTPDHVYQWLSSKVEANVELAEKGEKMGQCYRRIDNIVSACNKWAACADRTRGANLVPSMEKKMEEFRQKVLADMPDNPARIKAYENPEAVIHELGKGGGRPELNARASLVAEIQLRVGLRVDNARCFALLPDDKISIVSKGGMPHDKYQMPHDLYARMVEFNGGKLGRCELIAYRTYLDKLEGACHRLGINYHDHASHGFRHNHAQRYYKELIAKGTSETRAKALVSLDLFHQRLDVVEVYLKQ